MKSSSARERVEEGRVESRVGNEGIRTREAIIRTDQGIRTSTGWVLWGNERRGVACRDQSTYKMQNYKDRMTRELTTEDARDTCGS